MNFVKKILGIIDFQYYIKNLIIGIVIAMVAINFIPEGKEVSNLVVIVISLMLFPYSRYTYESIVNFFLGKAILVANTRFFIVAKIISMLLCFMFAIIIAPIGIIFSLFLKKSSKN